MFDLHVKGLRAVLDALPGSTGRMIYASSTGVYAQNAGEWVDEESVCEPVREGGKACLSAERLLFAHARGRDALVLRLAGALRTRADTPIGRRHRGQADCRFARCVP